MLYTSRRKTSAYRINRVHRYPNPHFRPTGNPQKSTGSYYSFLILSAVLAAWIYFLYASGIFRITDWEINGLKQYNKQEISDALQIFFGKQKFLIFRYSNIFIFNKNGFKKEFSSRFTFQNINIRKYYPHKIIIDFEEKKEKLAIYNKNKIYLVAEDGTIIREKGGVGNIIIATSTPASFDINNILADAKTKELPDYPIFYDAYNELAETAAGTIYPATKILQITSVFIENMRIRSNIGVKLAGFQKNNGSPKIIIYTDNNWKIYLNNIDDGLKQFYKFYAILNDKIKDSGKALEYIDLRFGDRVYIK